MRRLFVIGFVLAAFVAGESALLGPASAAVGDRPPEDRARGLVYAGLRQSARTSVCRGKFELESVRDRSGRPLCTHGPDPAPPGVDVRQRREPLPAARPAGGGSTPVPGTAADGSFSCDGDGTSGDRVQLVYARASNVTDHFSQYASSFLQWAAAMDNVFNSSAQETGGTRHVRFVQDASCNPTILRVTLSATGDDNFDNTVNELSSQGFTRSDRKYLIWADAAVYCGIGHVFDDDRASSDNYSNGSPATSAEMGRVDTGCWGRPDSVEAHELMHTLGGVQSSAPHGSSGNHCYDEYDRMCYDDGTTPALRYLCPASHENAFDCNHDDYFNTAPAPGTYLATHWNTANNVFLRSGSSVPAPTTTTTSTTTTTLPPPTTVPPTTAPPPSTTTTTRPPTGGWGLPSAPLNLLAGQPRTAGSTGIVLLWKPPSSPGTSAVTSYRVYRGATPSSLSLLAPNVISTSYADTTAARGKLYYYQVSAVNASGEGPRSATVRMIAK